jgi:hypothetical protein
MLRMLLILNILMMTRRLMKNILKDCLVLTEKKAEITVIMPGYICCIKLAGSTLHCVA